jgi:alpha-tubulin suppressor-like RCC1 family protein
VGLSGATAIGTGYEYSCALVHGTVECWGLGDDGQLGNGSYANGANSAPVKVKGISGVTAISVGYDAACALLAGGKVDCWGYGENGQLGNGTFDDSDVPVRTAGISGVKTISAGYDGTCALFGSGHVDCWGDDFYGEAGIGQTGLSLTPVTVVGLTL